MLTVRVSCLSCSISRSRRSIRLFSSVQERGDDCSSPSLSCCSDDDDVAANITKTSSSKRRMSQPIIQPPPKPETFPLWAYEPRSFFEFELLYESKKSLARVGKIHTVCNTRINLRIYRFASNSFCVLYLHSLASWYYRYCKFNLHHVHNINPNTFFSTMKYLFLT